VHVVRALVRAVGAPCPNTPALPDRPTEARRVVSGARWAVFVRRRQVAPACPSTHASKATSSEPDVDPRF
jgi:hypothetical protein